jgi:hypothetical protein
VTAPDHAARAREILDAAVESADAIGRMLNEPLGGEPRDQIAEIDARGLAAQQRLSSVDRLHAAAQVHATLALVEQQRVANVIAISQVDVGKGAFRGLVAEPAGEHRDGIAIRSDIAEALGLS